MVYDPGALTPRSFLEELERGMMQLYLDSGLRGVDEMVKFIGQRKEAFKEILKEKTGKAVRKTPRRGNNKVAELELRLRACNITFENEEAVNAERNRRIYTGGTPKTTQHGFKHEPASTVAPEELGDLPRLRSQTRNQLQRPPVKTPDMFGTPVSSRAGMSQKTPSTRQPKKQNLPFAEAVKAVVQEQDAIRRGNSPARSKTVRAEAAVPLPPRLIQKPTFKKSEVMRRMEAKQKAVINNREEIVKTKAERAKKDREDRAMRVLQNNKRKEEEREAALKAFRQRELDIEELRRQQMSPGRPFSKTCSRANSRSPARLKITQPTPVQQQPAGPSIVGEVKRQNLLHDCPNRTALTPQRNPIKRQSPISPVQNQKRSNLSREASAPIAADVPLCSGRRESETSSHTNAMEVDDAEPVPSSNAATEQNDLEMEEQDRDVIVESFQQDEAAVAEAQIAASGDAGEEKRPFSSEAKMADDDGEELEREKEEVRAKLGLLDSSQLKNKNLMNVTSCSSYEITPEKKPAASTENNYNIDDLSSGDETDEEDNPRKTIPSWAQPPNLRRALREQCRNPPRNLDGFFGQIETPDLTKIFSMQRSRYAKRTSSALWSSPLANPREGVSTYFALQARK